MVNNPIAEKLGILHEFKFTDPSPGWHLRHQIDIINSTSAVYQIS